MDASGRRRWLRTAILIGVVYLVVGVAFAAFAGWSASNQVRVTWRLAAWVISAAAFAAHVWHERFRLRNPALTTALHTSMAVAAGAFGLAVAANLHAQRAASGNWRLLALALVAWPALTAAPAFVAALVVAAALGLRRRST
jgi:vacuolar-type H+-ATPase subunit I/STV1